MKLPNFLDRKPRILVTNFQNIRRHIPQVDNFCTYAVIITKHSKN
jgi:hypothetical protein